MTNATKSAKARPNGKRQSPSGGLGRPTAIRFTEDTSAAIEAAVEVIRGERPGQRVDRADAIRILVHEALAARKIV